MDTRCRALDIENIARIAQMLIDGDKLEHILLDPYSIFFGFNDYHQENFNDIKFALMKIEKLNPDINLVALLWKVRPDNKNVMYLAAAGSTYAYEGINPVTTIPEVLRAVEMDKNSVKKREDGAVSYYYPVKNSDDEIVGVMELVENHFFFDKKRTFIDE